MGLKIAGLLLSAALLTGNITVVGAMAGGCVPGKQEQQEGVKKEKETEKILEVPETEISEEQKEHAGRKSKTDLKAEKEMTEQKERGKLEEEKWRGELPEEVVALAERYNTKEEYYKEQRDFVKKNGYFYIFLRKEGDKVEKGKWYKINMSVNSLSSYKSQAVSWNLLYLKSQKGNVSNISNWTWTEDSIVKRNDPFSFEIETGKSWEKTGQNAAGASPVLGTTGVPSHTNGYYFKLCGKFLYGYRGYQIAFDNSIYEDLDGFDIEEENKRIQKANGKLQEGEDSWTGDGYFKFAIDTNNTGMTNYGASGEFHNSVFGFKMVPNKYMVKYHANGGTGTMKAQSAVYDKPFTLRTNQFTRPGYTFLGWGTQETAWRHYKAGQSVVNLTDVQNGTVTLYAQWVPNTLTVKYHANGGTVAGTPLLAIDGFTNNWDYATPAKAPADIAEFGLVRTGYQKKTRGEWNTRADGQGTSFHEKTAYGMLSYAPDLTTGNKTISLYAQWVPEIYTITLDRRLTSLEEPGTGAVYEKYETGWYLNQECTSVLQEKGRAGSIAVPRKKGYVFQGYYDRAAGGTQMIAADGKLTAAGAAEYRHLGNAIWYAHYACEVACEDYADVPCDFKKAQGDSRENTDVLISYDKKSGQTTVKTGQTGVTVSLIGKPAGTKVGQFQSSIAGGSASALSQTSQIAELPVVPQEGAAYQLQGAVQGKRLFDRIVYFKNGRFRTLVKLGEKGKKEVAQGSSVAGSIWGTKEASYPLYQYAGCTELKNVQEPGMVYRYFYYKSVNMIYSGNGATSGNNVIEYGVSMENPYQFRKNWFTREEIQTKQTQDGKSYDCGVKYGFEGWNLSQDKSYQEHQQDMTAYIYREAEKVHGISDKPLEPVSSYRTEEPVIWGNKNAIPALEYVNFWAKWNAFPTIVVTPGNSLEFYEGEDVPKEKLTACLTAHDEEDNHRENQPYLPDLNNKIRITKIIYPKSKNGSQEAYEKVYDKDVPENFLLDTYYLKLEQEEEVTVQVTFAVTDSNGNTTEEEIPVKVKYNHYPEIISDEILYYLKEEANRGEITADELLGRASAEDVEDGALTEKLELKDFDSQILKMQTEARTEFDITYQVTDAYKKTTYKTVKLMVMDENAVVAEMPKYYVRYISEEYLDTLEENSTWREPENYAYLRNILRNETPVEIWKFNHEDVLAVQKWITGDGSGSWKTGQETNQEFLSKFSHCRQ